MPLTRADPATRTLAVNADTLTVRSVISIIDPDRSGEIGGVHRIRCWFG